MILNISVFHQIGIMHSRKNSKKNVFIWPDLKALYVVRISIQISIQPLPSNVRLSSSANVFSNPSHKVLQICIWMSSVWIITKYKRFRTNSWEAISPFSGDVQQPDRRREPCFLEGQSMNQRNRFRLRHFCGRIHLVSWWFNQPHWKILYIK